MSSTPPRLLTFTTLFPSQARPRHGIFVETRLQHIRRSSNIDVRVVAPVPWFPFKASTYGEYSQYARTLGEERRNGLQVYYPRYLTAPGIGMYTAPLAIASGAVQTIEALIRCGFDFDLIDAHYFYPDGVAAAILAKRFNKPLQITARGSDINLLPRFSAPRRMILWAARRAGAIVTVSAALKDRLVEMGVQESSIRVLRNGVDCDVFKPMERFQARAVLGVGAGPVFAAVGNLVPDKGHDLAVEAVALLPDATLLIVGDGSQRRSLEQKISELGLAGRVRMLPIRPQAELSIVYSAADALVLTSRREGWPNVLLEAMACGTPVVATNVGGVPEIVRGREAGITVPERSPSAVAAAMRDITAHPPDRGSTRRYAQQFGWDEIARAHVELMREILGRHRASSAFAQDVKG